ncbi:hypothetical protein INR49_008625 [Caranx melampygus]|nr:hypothetical protein INR49_008625 [Caranx melampygus]
MKVPVLNICGPFVNVQPATSSSGLCPWCLAVASNSAMMECLNIRSLQLIKKTVPDKNRRRGVI